MLTPRPIARTVWLALPATGALAGLVRSTPCAWTPAALAWALVMALSGVLSWRREMRLQATDRYLAAPPKAASPSALPDFGPLGGDELPAALHRLDRALAERRAPARDRAAGLDLAGCAARSVAAGRRRADRGQRQPGADPAVRRRSQQPAARGRAARSRPAGGGRSGAAGRGNTELTLQLPGPPGARSGSRSCRSGCAASRRP